MSGTRTLRNRSSRYSSPATFAEKDVHTKPAEAQEVKHGQQASLDKWMEPTVRHAVPSFEDTRGLERVGVLEHMAPLGVPPTQKLLQKLKVNLSRSTPRATPTPQEEVATPPPDARMEDSSPVRSEPMPDLPTEDDVMLISSPPRGRPAKRDADEMHQAVDPVTPSPSKADFSQTLASPKPQSIQEHLRQDRMRSIFDRAIRVAEDHPNSARLVPGLQLIFDDAKSITSLWTVLDAVLNKTPTDAQFKVFKRYIKKGIRQHRRESEATTSPSQQSHTTTNHLTSPRSQPVGFLHTFPIHTSVKPTLPQDTPVINSPFRFKPPNNGVLPISPSQQVSISPQMKGISMLESVNSAIQEEIEIPSQNRKRSSSLSSASSLTTVPDDLSSTHDDEPEIQAGQGEPAKLAGQRQAANGVAAASRTRSSVVNHPEPSHPYSGFPTTIKFINKKLPKTKLTEDSLLEAQELEAKKREYLQDSFYDYNDILRPESSERADTHGHPVGDETSSKQVPPPVLHPHRLLPSLALNSSATLQEPPELLIPNGTARKRSYDEISIDDRSVVSISTLSPTPSLGPPPPPPANIERGTTPRSGRLPPPKKARKSARVMISPNKTKTGGITAGISRAGPGGDVVNGEGMGTGSEENDEFCASCSGEGILLCCDGCTNSFHHACLEPPLNPDDDVDGEWYCPRCVARRNKEPLLMTGLLSHVIRRVDDTIPKAYSLPFDIRDYFEGVKTGDEGEYEDIGLPRTQNTGAKMNRAGFFEEPNYKELRDSKGNFITCWYCGLTSNGRDIIPCDYCPAKWHTDCIDPPLAVPPRRRPGEKATGYWRCPLHVDQDLVAIGRHAEAAPGDLGRLPRLRKPKNAIPIDICTARGFRNNGVIEVELIRDDMPEMREIIREHGVYRLPEKGIRLDFIDRVKKSWYEDRLLPRQMSAEPRIRNRLYRPGQTPLHHPPAYTIIKQREPNFFKGVTAISVAETAKANVQLRQKSFKEQSAVMSLLGMADSHELRNNLSVDPLADLTNTLVASAPAEVEDRFNISEKDQLLKLRDLIEGRLALFSAGQELGTEKAMETTKVLNKRNHIHQTNGTALELNGEADEDGDDEGDGGSVMDVAV